MLSYPLLYVLLLLLLLLLLCLTHDTHLVPCCILHLCGAQERDATMCLTGQLVSATCAMSMLGCRLHSAASQTEGSLQPEQTPSQPAPGQPCSSPPSTDQQAWARQQELLDTLAAAVINSTQQQQPSPLQPPLPNTSALLLPGPQIPEHAPSPTLVPSSRCGPAFLPACLPA